MAEVNDTLNESTGSTSSLNEYIPPLENCLYDTQQIAPGKLVIKLFFLFLVELLISGRIETNLIILSSAPGTTYYQLLVKSKDLVILRDWPKMRMSQKWSRNGNFNPGEKKMTVS